MKFEKLNEDKIRITLDIKELQDKEEITKDIMQEYNLSSEMYKELYENGGLAFHLKFMYPQTITNRRV